MTIEKIEKALEGHEKADEILSLVKDHTTNSAKSEAEKAATEAKRKANNEAKNVRDRYKKKWDDLGLDPDSEEFDSYIDDLKEKLEKAKEKDTSDNSVIKSLEKRIEKAEKKAKDAEDREKASVQKALRKDAESQLVSALTEKKAIKPQILLSSLMPNVQIGKDDETPHVFKSGDEDLTLTEGVEKFLEANPEFVANQGNPGGGSGGGKGGAGTPNKKTDLEERRKQLRNVNKSLV